MIKILTQLYMTSFIFIIFALLKTNKIKLLAFSIYFLHYHHPIYNSAFIFITFLPNRQISI
jgi:hypothetical protein